MEDTKEYLGRGMKFPPQVDAVTGRFKQVSYEEDIKEAIYILLMTSKGERVMLPDFGCDIQKFIYDIPSSTYVSLLKIEILDALVKWEPRISNIEIEIDTAELSNAKVLIKLQYLVRTTNHSDNLVFPYYLEQGRVAE